MTPVPEIFTFLDESPTAYHAAENLSRKFTASGWTLLNEKDAWELRPGQGYLVRRGPGCLAAFTLGQPSQPVGWKIAAAHTDSPGLKIKTASAQPLDNGLVRWGVEVYGAPLLSTWTDRTLGVAGAVWVRGSKEPQAIGLRTEALAVIPNLAIHYNRDFNKGFSLDPQTHLSVIADAGPFPNWQSWLAARLDTAVEQILASELFLYDVQPASCLGSTGLYQSGRIDNLAGCHALAQALVDTVEKSGEGFRLALFLDNEEIGSGSAVGADSQFLPALLDRLNLHSGLTGEKSHQQRANSFLVSVDAAHGLHPNYPDRHDPAYSPKLGSGPVLKSAARQSYSTTGETLAIFRNLLATDAPAWQNFVMRSDLTPGSTVGPLLSAGAGLAALDFGVPIWAMHSIRETAHLGDQAAMVSLLSSYWR